MPITIEPTAQGLFEAMQLLPPEERERFKQLARVSFPLPETAEEEEADWHRISQTSATRFFEEEEKA